MTFKINDNQYGRPYPSDSWASCLLYDMLYDKSTTNRTANPQHVKNASVKSMRPIAVALISISLALSQTPDTSLH